MLLFIYVLLFLLAALLFYPFTLKLVSEAGCIRVYLLPRLFMGYGRERLLTIPGILKRRPKKKLSLKKLKTGFAWARSILAALRLHKFYFFGAVACPLHGECIISLRLWDIMVKSLQVLAHKLRRI